MRRVSFLTRLVTVGLASWLGGGCSEGAQAPLATDGGDAGSGSDAADDASAPVDAGTCFATAADFPSPAAGRCEAEILDPGASLPVGDDAAGGFIIPGGRRVTRVGRQLRLPGFPSRVVPIPGTRFVVVSDGARNDELLRVIDVDSMTVVASRSFHSGDGSDEALFLGLAVSPDGRRLWASGGGSNRIFTYDVDATTGALTDAPAREIRLGDPTPRMGHFAGIALSPDGTKLVAALLLADAVAVFDATTGAEVGRVGLDTGAHPYDVVIVPDGSRAYVSEWGGAAVVPLDLTALTAGTPIPVGAMPQGLALSPDAARLIVASANADQLAVIDVTVGAVVAQIDVHAPMAPRGASPVAVAFDASGRLYAVDAGDGAVDVLEPASPGYHRIGRIPTMWYPSDVTVLADGSVVVINAKHESTGPNLDPMVDIMARVGGSLQVVDASELTPSALASWEMETGSNVSRATRFSDVTCPAGTSYDFPIPMPGMGPSTKIEHVLLLVRENKTYDAYFGAFHDASGAPAGNGDATLTLLPTDTTDQVLQNTFALARRFAFSDNYYSDAEQSVQGHIWTSAGRTTDVVERVWLNSTGYGRSYVGPDLELIRPDEGTAFDYMRANGVSFANYGEIVGSSHTGGPSAGYPGFVVNIDTPDPDRARYLDRRWRSYCQLPTFTYMVMPRDHTFGGSGGRPTPASMIADNDDGIGIAMDALSHSTWWPTSVVFIVEDDPQDGGDHVDNHRSPLIVVSPWAKRGTISHVNANEASIYRTIQLILGLPEPLNDFWANAAPLYDVFTSTPDYAPYDRIERTWPEEINGASGRDAEMWRGTDWSVVDEQPGLSRWLWAHFHGLHLPPDALRGPRAGDFDDVDDLDDR